MEHVGHVDVKRRHFAKTEGIVLYLYVLFALLGWSKGRRDRIRTEEVGKEEVGRNEMMMMMMMLGFPI